LVAGEALSFLLVRVDQLQEERPVVLVAAHGAAAAEPGRVLAMPDHLAVLQEDELAAVAVDETALVLLVEETLLAGRPAPALDDRGRVGLDRVEMGQRAGDVRLE